MVSIGSTLKVQEELFPSGSITLICTAVFVDMVVPGNGFCVMNKPPEQLSLLLVMPT